MKYGKHLAPDIDVLLLVSQATQNLISTDLSCQTLRRGRKYSAENSDRMGSALGTPEL